MIYVQSLIEYIIAGLLDTAGQDDFDKFRPISYNDAEVFMVCFSVVSPDSFKNADRKYVLDVLLLLSYRVFQVARVGSPGVEASRDCILSKESRAVWEFLAS